MMTDTEELESTSQEKILFMDEEVQDKIEGKCQKEKHKVF